MKTLQLFLLTCFISTSLVTAQNSVLDFYEADIKSTKLDGHVPKVLIKDLNNGFIRYNLGDFTHDLAYFIANNGKKILAKLSYNCVRGCKDIVLKFYEMQNAQLIDKTETYFPKNTQKEIFDYLNESIMNVQAFRSQKYNMFPVPIAWIKLPQYGTSIKFGLFDKDMGTAERFDSHYELKFNLTNGNFIPTRTSGRLLKFEVTEKIEQAKECEGGQRFRSQHFDCLHSLVQYPVFKSGQYSDLINANIKEFIFDDVDIYPGANPEEKLQNKMKSFLKSCDGISTTRACFEEEKVFVEFIHENVLCLAYERSAYLGGAHPIYYRTYTNYYLHPSHPKGGTKVKLNDIIKNKKALTEYAEKAFRKYKALSSTDRLPMAFMNGFYLSENFGILEDQLIIYDNPIFEYPLVLCTGDEKNLQALKG